LLAQDDMPLFSLPLGIPRLGVLMAQWRRLLLLLCVCRNGEDGRHAVPGVGREGGRAEAADRLCDHRGAVDYLARYLTSGELPKHVPRRHGACTRCGGVVLGIDIGTGDQGSEVVRLDKPGLA
jgi:hypothetical protein